MSRLEALRTELDAVKVEKERLEAENAKLRDGSASGGGDGKPDAQLTELEAERDSLTEECKKLKMLYEGVLSEMQQEQEKAAEELSELQQTIESLHSKQEKVERDAAEWEREASELPINTTLEPTTHSVTTVTTGGGVTDGTNLSGCSGGEAVESRIYRDTGAWLQMGGPPREMERRCMLRRCQQHIYH